MHREGTGRKVRDRRRKKGRSETREERLDTAEGRKKGQIKQKEKSKARDIRRKKGRSETAEVRMEGHIKQKVGRKGRYSQWKEERT